MGVTSIYANSPRTATIIVCPGAIVIGFCLGVAAILFLAFGSCIEMTGYCLMEISIPSRVVDFNLMIINIPS